MRRYTGMSANNHRVMNASRPLFTMRISIFHRCGYYRSFRCLCDFVFNVFVVVQSFFSALTHSVVEQSPSLVWSEMVRDRKLLLYILESSITVITVITITIVIAILVIVVVVYVVLDVASSSSTSYSSPWSLIPSLFSVKGDSSKKKILILC